jgi:uncharacterized protein (DUF849 family)
MTDTQKKVLEMLAQNKISADEAYRLLNAIGGEGERQVPPQDEPRSQSRSKPKYLRVTIQPNPDNPDAAKYDRVNVRVPLSLIRAGMRLTSLIPPNAYDKINGSLKEKGIDFDLRSIKPEDLEEIIEALGDMQIDVEGGRGERVRVFAE